MTVKFTLKQQSKFAAQTVEKLLLLKTALFDFPSPACSGRALTNFSYPVSYRERLSVLFKFSGGFVERVTPVPIPNTEVKPLGADGTAREGVWESRKPPG